MQRATASFFFCCYTSSCPLPLPLPPKCPLLQAALSEPQVRCVHGLLAPVSRAACGDRDGDGTWGSELGQGLRGPVLNQVPSWDVWGRRPAP